MAKTFTLEQIKEAMEQEIITCIVEVERDFDAKLDDCNGGCSWEELRNEVTWINEAKMFERAVIRRLGNADEKTEECKCNRCCYKDICEDAYWKEVCNRFLAKF